MNYNSDFINYFIHFLLTEGVRHFGMVDWSQQQKWFKFPESSQRQDDSDIFSALTPKVETIILFLN
jgi:hypothetical protein